MTLELLGMDAGAKKIVTPDGSTLEISGTSLRAKAAGITESHLNTSVAGAGLTGGGGTALAVDIHEVSAAVIAPAADFILFEDATDNSTKKEAVADLVGLIADGVTTTAASGQLSVVTTGFVTQFTATLGETMSTGTAVYLKSDGKVWKAKADTASTMPCCGFVATGGDAEGTSAIIQTGVMASVLGGGALTVGGKCFVSAATAGQVTQTAPSGASNVIQPVGVMATAANLLVNIGEDVVRPAA